MSIQYEVGCWGDYMHEKKIVAIIGSKNKNSITKFIMNRMLENIVAKNKDYFYDLFCMSDFNIEYCIGCNTCFKQGFCPMDQKDDFGIIRRELKKADILFFASPVYGHNISGIMKTFFDRTAVSCHLLDFAGKLGFTLTTTCCNGQEKVKLYLKDFQSSMGIKNLNNFEYIKIADSIEEFVEINTLKFLSDMGFNFGYSNRYLEHAFTSMKNLYIQIKADSLYIDEINTYEWKYWNQKWVKECKSFQEFAVKFKNNGDKLIL